MFFGFLRSASVFKQGATPTLTPTIDYYTKTRLAHTFLIFCKNLNESLFHLSIPIYLQKVIKIGSVIKSYSQIIINMLQFNRDCA